MDRTAIKLIMKLRYDISIGPKNEGNAILVKNRLIVAAFHLQTHIRFFLVRLRYTGTIISSAATVLEAYYSASASPGEPYWCPLSTQYALSHCYSTQYALSHCYQTSFLLDSHASHQQRFLIEGLSTQLLSAKLQLLERPSDKLCHKLESGGHVCFREESPPNHTPEFWYEGREMSLLNCSNRFCRSMT
jgi:hypothetical protein